MEKELKELKKIVDKLEKIIAMEQRKVHNLERLCKKEKSKVIRMNSQLSTLQAKLSTITRQTRGQR